MFAFLLMNDLKFAFRQFLKNPGFTAVAVFTLALCIGANLTIFAVVDAVLVRPLPFPEPDRVVTMFNTYPKAGIERNGASLVNYYERRGNVPAFSDIAIYSQGTAIIGETGSTEQMEVMRVSPEFFTTRGVDPIMVRAFTNEEMTYQNDGVAILTDPYWRQRFNADSSILGRQIRVDGSQKTIVGILPPSFRFLSSRAQLYLPLSSSPRMECPMAKLQFPKKLQCPMFKAACGPSGAWVFVLGNYLDFGHRALGLCH